MCFRPNPFICHTSGKSARKSNHCHTSKKLLPQPLCLPHIRAPRGIYPPQTFAPIFSHLAIRHSPLSRNPFRMRSYKQTPCFARFWPKLSARNSFRMRSYANRRRNPFRMRTYKKSRGAPWGHPDRCEGSLAVAGILPCSLPLPKMKRNRETKSHSLALLVCEISDGVRRDSLPWGIHPDPPVPQQAHPCLPLNGQGCASPLCEGQGRKIQGRLCVKSSSP